MLWCSTKLRDNIPLYRILVLHLWVFGGPAPDALGRLEAVSPHRYGQLLLGRVVVTLFPRRDKKDLHWTPITTVPKKFHYFSNLKNVFKTWFRRPTNDLIELCFLWFYMCFCKKNHLNRYFETLYGLFSSWWPNRVIIWYFEPKKPKNSVFWGIVCFVATFLQADTIIARHPGKCSCEAATKSKRAREMSFTSCKHVGAVYLSFFAS